MLMQGQKNPGYMYEIDDLAADQDRILGVFVLCQWRPLASVDSSVVTEASAGCLGDVIVSLPHDSIH